MHHSARKYAILLLLALMGVGVYVGAPSPRKSLRLVPSPAARAVLETFSDSGVTGKSHVTLADRGDTLVAAITLSAPQGKDAWAGIGWRIADLGGNKANWTFMDTLHVQIRAQGISEVQLTILTFDPDHTKPTDRSTYRQMIKEIPVKSEWTSIALPAELFYIPEWWYAQQGVDRKLDSKHLEGVFRLDLSPSPGAPREVPLQIEVRSLDLVGKSSRNLAILLGYILLLTLIALGTNPNKRRLDP